MTLIPELVWNFVAYSAATMIIVSLFLPKYRNLIFLVTAVVLAVYSGYFLQNKIFMSLQFIIAFSAFLAMRREVTFRSVKETSHTFFDGCAIASVAFIVFIYLIATGVVNDLWSYVGIFGLLGIAFGLVIIPEIKFGFIIMAVSGGLLAIYAFVTDATVFVFLNAFFAAANAGIYVRRRLDDIEII